MARFWNKYPYTDLHELNIGWCIDKITDFEARVTSVEEDVAALKVRATALETRMTTAEERIARQEQDIHGLSTTIGNIGTRVTALESADIQDAVMIEGVSSVEAGNASVTVNFSAAAYADGERTEGADVAVIPAASSSAAGVMLPGEKAKLAPITVNGNDVTFAGKVSGADPTGSGNFTTKSYVDSLAISGSAEVAFDSAPLVTNWHEFGVTESIGTTRVYTYGKVVQLKVSLFKELDESHVAGTALFTAKIKADYQGTLGARGYLLKTAQHPYTMMPVRIQMDAQNVMSIIADDPIDAGEEVSISLDVFYLILQ